MNSASPMNSDFDRALKTCRPPNIVRLFPNSRALLVSGKAIDRGLAAKGHAMTIAANGRNLFVIHGALRAAQRANAAIICEIAKSEGGRNAYCATSFWNLARRVDAACNELGITVPVAIHADHYAIKGPDDVERASDEIPSMFDAGITSIAVDASHLPDDENLLASLKVLPLAPLWAGIETEVGEIKGIEGMSTPEEALFLVRGLNAHGIFPDWIALNNGSAHGIQSSEQGIQVDLTVRIHEAIASYNVSGAQHGTSGNSSDRLRRIAAGTRTTKANVATALQMVSWGVRVNDYGNAELDDQGRFIKEPSKGMSEALWAEMTEAAGKMGLKGGAFKKLNLPFENRLMAQPADIRERMTQGVEDFVYRLLTDVFNAGDTAPLVMEALLAAGSHDIGPKSERLEDPAQWTTEKIRARAPMIDRSTDQDKGKGGDYDD
ncbi:MAG: class II fructose-bisphosphate aldolase [Deltaproteobacteria bacterium]|nr:class II fructose-bisphosphate aldolase [Deltaproteobacteria bacterium]